MTTILIDLHEAVQTHKFIIEMLMLIIGSCCAAWFLSSELKNARRAK